MLFRYFFLPQGIHGVRPGSAVGGVKAEKNPNGGREGEREWDEPTAL